jgi:16S rRNA processing protein RimM
VNSNKDLHDSLLLIGKVIRPHGLAGLLKISSYAQSPETFINSGAVYLESGSGALSEHRVSSIRPQKNFFLLKLEGVNTLEESEPYRGAEIYINKERLSGKEAGEYFWFELIGIKAYSTSGELIGTVRNVFSTRSNDVYVIENEKKEILVPATHGAVREIDLENERMIISEMEGCIDLNEG